MFEEIAEQRLDDYTTANTPLENIVDPFEFVTSVSYASQDPTVFQRIALKTIYHLWDLYPPDLEEQALIELEERKWGLKIDFSPSSIKNVLVMILGRRSGKSVLSSFIANYDVYSLLTLGNPQKYYGMIEKYPIHILHVAAKGDQAADMFTLSKNLAKKIPFFQSYINFDKDNTQILGFFTPYDLYLNNEIRKRNSLLPRGSMKENLLPSSIAIESVTTSGATNRGKAIYTLILSELAHFPRAKMEGGQYTENPETDHAIVTGLVPSLKDFHGDGKLIIDTSPAEKGGEAYNYYMMGGGQEVDRPDDPNQVADIIESDPTIQVFQFSTWEVSPVVRGREELETEFKRDSVGSDSEWGAHFSNPSALFVSEKLVALVPQANVMIRRNNIGGKYKFVIAVDPGGKAKKKQADTYALSWGHFEIPNYGQSNPIYYIDGMHGWDARVKTLQNNLREVIPVDPNIVVNYITDLVQELGGPNYIYEIVYDQWNSSAPISTLQNMNYPALETTFTNSYKAAMYGTLFNMIEQGQVKMYGIDEGGYIYRWKQEMKYLQKIVSGNTVYYEHPSSGPVQHDDFSDVNANCVYRLSLIADPTKRSLQDRMKKDQPPVQHPKIILPKAGNGLWSSRRGGPAILPTTRNLRNRFR